MPPVADPNRSGVAPIADEPTRAREFRGVPARVFGPLLRLGVDSPRYTPLAVLLVLAMIPLFGALALDDRRLHGIDVWIKPLKFLAALTVYLLTLAWATRHADPRVTGRAAWRWHECAVVVAVVLEMLWIGGAAALGTASHFNESTRFAAAVYGVMGAAAVVLTSASATLAWAIHRHPGAALSPAVRCGLVWGLALTLPLTLLTAGTMSDRDGHWIGGTANDAGGLMLMGWSRDGGDLRVAHFFATHALHAVPLAALACSRVFGREALTPVRCAALAYAAFVAWTFVQALSGQPFLAARAAPAG